MQNYKEFFLGQEVFFDNISDIFYLAKFNEWTFTLPCTEDLSLQPMIEVKDIIAFVLRPTRICYSEGRAYDPCDRAF